MSISKDKSQFAESMIQGFLPELDLVADELVQDYWSTELSDTGANSDEIGFGTGSFSAELIEVFEQLKPVVDLLLSVGIVGFIQSYYYQHKSKKDHVELVQLIKQEFDLRIKEENELKFQLKDLYRKLNKLREINDLKGYDELLVETIIQDLKEKELD